MKIKTRLDFIKNNNVEKNPELLLNKFIYYGYCNSIYYVYKIKYKFNLGYSLFAIDKNNKRYVLYIEDFQTKPFYGIEIEHAKNTFII